MRTRLPLLPYQRGVGSEVEQFGGVEHGEIGVRPLRGAQATDEFILSGGDDRFEPTFTFHGFRYAEVTGWPGELDPRAVVAEVLHSQMERTGTFAASDPLVDRLHRSR